MKTKRRRHARPNRVVFGIACAMACAAGERAGGVEPEARSAAVALRGLPVAVRVLMIGAHPDDEDSAFLAEVALRRGADAYYLSLTRGEGGQNRLGEEQGAALGLLRRGELLAARELDGAHQLLGPFIDFGFSKQPDEAFARWGRERMVAVAVQAIRTVRPDVVVSVWRGDAGDGHGHHQACGQATRAAFALAGDPRAFAAQLAAGLAPWRATRLLVRAPRDDEVEGGGETACVEVNVGAWDPVLGRSPLEIAMEGRSLHRSQDMGAARPKGAAWRRYEVAVDGARDRGDGDRDGDRGRDRAHDGIEPEEPGAVAVVGGDPLAGTASRLSQWVRATATRARVAPVIDGIEQAEAQLELAWERYHPARLAGTAERLGGALAELRRAAARLARPASAGDERGGRRADQERAAIAERLGSTTRRVERLWAELSGIALEVTAAAGEVVPGASLECEVSLHARGERGVTLERLDALVADPLEWRFLEPPELPLELEAGSTVTLAGELAVPAAAAAPAIAAALPPWLRLPPEGDAYAFPSSLPSLAPGAAPLLEVEAVVACGATRAPVRASLVYRWVDPGLGEREAPVRVVDAVEVALSPPVSVVPRGTNEPVRVTVTLRSHADGGALAGELALHADHAPGGADVAVLARAHAPSGEQAVSFELALPAELSRPGDWTFSATGVNDATAFPPAESFTRAFAVVDYPHIAALHFLRPARAQLAVVDVEVAAGLHVGYVPGAGDATVAALASLGVAAETVGVDALRRGDLERFDTVIVGIRALEVREELAPYVGQLWEYARAGGSLVVQYHKPRGAGGVARFLPFPGAAMSQPAARVTDETAPVTLLRADHALLAFPNAIDAGDFEGWVQERGLYFLSAWPLELAPLLSSADAGEPGQEGGLLYGRLGRGHYVYCAYALFRQLPAGVPGAYRLLANLVSLPAAGTPAGGTR